MSYCRNCGSEINDSAKFCAKCGTATGIPTVNPVSSPISYLDQQKSVRTETLTELNRMISYFSKKQAQYDEWYSRTEKINNPNLLRNDIHLSEKKGMTLVILGVILFVLNNVFVFFVPGIVSLFSQDDSYVMLISLAALYLLFPTLGIVLIVIGGIKESKYNKAFKQTMSDLKHQNSERAESLFNELYQYFIDYNTVLINFELSSPYALATIKDKVESTEADTIKEALAVIKQDKHYKIMEDNARRTADAATRGAKSAQITAIASSATALFSTMTYFRGVKIRIK